MAVGRCGAKLYHNSGAVLSDVSKAFKDRSDL